MSNRPFTQYDETISPTQEDNGSNGADDAPVQDNGTRDASFSVGGMPSVSTVDYPLPPDPNAPPGETGGDGEAEISDYGLNESVEVGFNGSPNSYGIDGSPAGGGVSRNKQE